MSEKVNLFSADLKKLLTTVHSEKRVKKGAYFFQEGDKADGIYYIHSGKVRIGKITPDGQEITFKICHEEDFFGEFLPFCAISIYPFHARAHEDTICSKIQKEDLEEALLLNPELNIEFIKWLGIKHRKAQSKIRDLILHGKKGALYSTLIRMSNSYGVHQHNNDILIDLSLTNRELSNFCGTSREVVNRMLNELKKNGVVSMIDSKIIIHNLSYLKEQIHCENCPKEICSID